MRGGDTGAQVMEGGEGVGTGSPVMEGGKGERIISSREPRGASSATIMRGRPSTMPYSLHTRAGLIGTGDTVHH